MEGIFEVPPVWPTARRGARRAARVRGERAGGRARTPGPRRRAHARADQRTHGGRRPTCARSAARCCASTPSTSTAAHARGRPARDPRQPLRRRAGGAAARLCGCPWAGAETRAGARAARERRGFSASASSTCSTSRSPRSTRSRPTRRSTPRCSPRASGCAALDSLLAGAGAAAGRLLGEDASAAGAGAGGDAGAGASQLVAEASAALGPLEGVDPQLDELAERLRALALETQELAYELAGYCERAAAGGREHGGRDGRLDARGARGTPRGHRAPGSQARRQHRVRARARDRGTGPARGARRRAPVGRELEQQLEDAARGSSASRPRAAGVPARRRPGRSRRTSWRSWPRSRCRTPASRSPSAAARRDPPAPTRSSS